MHKPTYAQIAANAHAAGGETQTEATAKMRRLASKPPMFLHAILEHLQREAEACTTMEQYNAVRAQIVRVDQALSHRAIR